ncbi:MAG: hypothetical protein U1E75_09130 [Alicycliphilus sp.]
MTDLLRQQGVAMEDALFQPVLHKQEWVAVLDKSARILGFVPGDGFAVRSAGSDSTGLALALGTLRVVRE